MTAVNFTTIDRSGQPGTSSSGRRIRPHVDGPSKYSTENQSDAIQKQYAEARGIEIVKTYADAGKSGLKIEGRDAAQAAHRDVRSGSTDFSLVLVYDVSRWGAFRMPTRAPTTNISADAPASPWILRRAIRQRRQPDLDHRQGRQARDGRANTAVNSQPRCSRVRSG